MKRFNLKIFREKQGLNQSEMAKKLGISKSYYVAIELGNNDPSFLVVRRYLRTCREIVCIILLLL